MSVRIAKVSVALLLFVGAAGTSFAQIPDDVGISIPSEFVVYKPKNGGAQLSFQSWVIYFIPRPDLKAKATGIANLYLSADGTIDGGDVLIGTKNVKVKAFKTKIVKTKVNLTQADKGKWIIAEIISPEDQYASNNVVKRQILASDF